MTYMHRHDGGMLPHVHEGIPQPHTHEDIPNPGAANVASHQIHDRELHYPKHDSNETPLMRFEDFCFAYDEEPTLRHVDLDIYAGDSIVLMGYNGSGKSTLL